MRRKIDNRARVIRSDKNLAAICPVSICCLPNQNAFQLLVIRDDDDNEESEDENKMLLERRGSVFHSFVL
jgi:hypothetical protein